jgi:hypothetical protein
MHEQLRRLFQAAKCSTSCVVTANTVHDEVSQEMKQRRQQQFTVITREGHKQILIRIPVPVLDEHGAEPKTAEACMNICIY